MNRKHSKMVSRDYFSINPSCEFGSKAQAFSNGNRDLHSLQQFLTRSRSYTEDFIQREGGRLIKTRAALYPTAYIKNQISDPDNIGHCVLMQ